MPSKWMKDFLAKKYEEHRKRVKEARTTLAQGKPPEMPMSMRREMERKRVQHAIEQDNRLLMDRLAVAMSSKNIDNQLVPKPFVSYIELQRKKDMARVTQENRRLLDRIQKTQPSYNSMQWEQDAEKRVHYLRNMTQFPDYFNPPALQALETMQKKNEKVLQRTRGSSRERSRGGGSGVLRHGEEEQIEASSPAPPPPEEGPGAEGRVYRPFILPPI